MASKKAEAGGEDDDVQFLGEFFDTIWILVLKAVEGEVENVQEWEEIKGMQGPKIIPKEEPGDPLITDEDEVKEEPFDEVYTDDADTVEGKHFQNHFL